MVLHTQQEMYTVATILALFRTKTFCFSNGRIELIGSPCIRHMTVGFLGVPRARFVPAAPRCEHHISLGL